MTERNEMVVQMFISLIIVSVVLLAIALFNNNGLELLNNLNH